MEELAAVGGGGGRNSDRPKRERAKMSGEQGGSEQGGSEQGSGEQGGGDEPQMGEERTWVACDACSKWRQLAAGGER